MAAQADSDVSVVSTNAPASPLTESVHCNAQGSSSDNSKQQRCKENQHETFRRVTQQGYNASNHRPFHAHSFPIHVVNTRILIRMLSHMPLCHRPETFLQDLLAYSSPPRRPV